MNSWRKSLCRCLGVSQMGRNIYKYIFFQNPGGGRCPSEWFKPVLFSLRTHVELEGLAGAVGLQQTDTKAPGREAPLGKGAAVNYFYSLEMTYLIHSVSYLPSRLSSRSSESYKHVHFFIFGDRMRVEGDAMRSKGGRVINASGPHGAGLAEAGPNPSPRG